MTPEKVMAAQAENLPNLGFQALIPKKTSVVSSSPLAIDSQIYTVYNNTNATITLTLTNSSGTSLGVAIPIFAYSKETFATLNDGSQYLTGNGLTVLFYQ